MHHHKRSAMQTDRLHQERMLNEVIKLIGISRDISGFLDQQEFDRTVGDLLRIGLIKNSVAYEDFFLKSVQPI